MADNTRQQSVYEICKRVLASSGLPVPTAIAGNPDALATQILALLNEEGQKLLDFGWKFLEKTFSLNTVPGTLEYDLPSDWDMWIDETDWNTSTRLPLVLMDSKRWAMLAATTLGSTTFQLQYQLTGNKIKFYAVPGTPQALQIAYRSRGWVKKAAAAEFKDNADDNGDIIQYDSRLMVAALKLALRREKGFDTSATQTEFDAALQAALNADVPGQEFSLRPSPAPLLGHVNLPETGYGT